MGQKMDMQTIGCTLKYVVAPEESWTQTVRYDLSIIIIIIIILWILCYPSYKYICLQIYTQLSQNMNLINSFKAFLVSITKLLLQILLKFDPWLPRPAPPSDNAVDLEAPPQPAGLIVEHCQKDWTKTMVVFCLTSAIAIALLPLQVHSQLPTSLLLLSVEILLCFTCFFVSEFIDSKFVVTVRVLKKFGELFTVTAFFMAITIPFLFYLKCTSWAFYSISILFVLISSCF